MWIGVLFAATHAAAAQKPEALWYARGELSVQSFLAHADQISIISPQVFTLDKDGVIRGSIDHRIIDKARANGVKLVPLLMNPGFDQPAIHRVLTEGDVPASRDPEHRRDVPRESPRRNPVRHRECARRGQGRLHIIRPRIGRFGASGRLYAFGGRRAANR